PVLMSWIIGTRLAVSTHMPRIPAIAHPMVKPTIERISPARPVEGRDLIAPINDKMAAAKPAYPAIQSSLKPVGNGHQPNRVPNPEETARSAAKMATMRPIHVNGNTGRREGCDGRRRVLWAIGT